MAQTLQDPIGKIIRQLLLDRGLASSSGDWQCFYGNEPSVPDNCISVYGTAGVGAGSLMVSGDQAGHQGFQIRIRGKDEDTACARADAIYTEFNGVPHAQLVTVSGRQYAVWPITPDDPLPNGREPETSRCVYTMNCLAAIDTWPL